MRTYILLLHLCLETNLSKVVSGVEACANLRSLGDESSLQFLSIDSLISVIKYFISMNLLLKIQMAFWNMFFDDSPIMKRVLGYVQLIRKG